MARVETDPNYTGPTFSRATAGTDLFKKEDVQQLAAAVSTHIHDGVHGLALVAGSIPDGTITSAKIANGTIVAADIAPGTITSNEIADGTIATADLANASVTNAKLASDTARANLLTNGGFEIWQRGNGPFTAVGTAYSADRWQLQGAGISVSRDTANTDSSAACAAVTCSAPTVYLSHRVENFTELRGRTISLSIRVRGTVASAARAAINVIGGAGVVYSSYHTGGGAYQTLTVTTPVAAGATAIDTLLEFALAGTFYIDNAMLVVGSVAADYAPLHPADDLARCLRYYEVLGDAYPYPLLSGYNAASTAVYGSVAYLARKAVAPTVTKNGTWAVTNSAQPTVVGGTLSGVVLQMIPTATGYAIVQPTAAGHNLTVESNP